MDSCDSTGQSIICGGMCYKKELKFGCDWIWISSEKQFKKHLIFYVFIVQYIELLFLASYHYTLIVFPPRGFLYFTVSNWLTYC